MILPESKENQKHHSNNMKKRYYIRPINSELRIRIQLKELRRLQENHGKEKVILDTADLPVVFVEINPS